MPGATRSICGAVPGGAQVEEIVLESGSGVSATVLSYGATLHRLTCPDRDGSIDDILVGFDDWRSHVASRAFFGPVVGRYANRIADGRFALDGRDHQLDRNDGGNCLHGGHLGLDNRIWEIVEVGSDHETASALLGCISPDGEGGFPGNLTVEARYTLDRAGALTIDLRARTDACTVVNLTTHPLFNLAGARSSANILGHQLMVLAEGFAPVDERRIPLGRIEPIAGTAFDFRSGASLGTVLEPLADPQMAAAGGIDHSFALRGGAVTDPRAAAVLAEPGSGRRLSIATNQPALHIYTANDLDGGQAGKCGQALARWRGIAFEPQHFPDSPNQPVFPSTRLDPGETWHSLTTYAFGTD